MRITLNGDLGSGKSTIGTLLSRRLNIPYFSSGQMFREIGKISNMDALQTNLAAENNSQIDFEVDNRIKAMSESMSDFILDSRMAWHFSKDSINVFLSVDPETAAERVMADKSRSSESYPTLNAAIAALRTRRESENKRYKALYGVNIDDLQNYDVVVLTDDADPDDIVDLIVRFASGSRAHKFWIPKTRLVPMISIRDASHIGFATRFDVEDKFELPICVQKNFGFFFGSAPDLMAAFFYKIRMVPYLDKRPEFLNETADVAELAKKTLSASDLYDWEDVGLVKLVFSHALGGAPGH